jgi:hypothetical protein
VLRIVLRVHWQFSSLFVCGVLPGPGWGGGALGLGSFGFFLVFLVFGCHGLGVSGGEGVGGVGGLIGGIDSGCGGCGWGWFDRLAVRDVGCVLGRAP